jgi:hypothetical protein
MKNKKPPVFGETKGSYITSDQVELKSNTLSNQETLQSNIFAVMKSSKVIRLHRCFACEKSFAVKKMSSALIICKACLSKATTQGKGKVARNNFVEKALNNIQKFLRRRVAV